MREIKLFLRVENGISRIVDINNNVLSSNYYPVFTYGEQVSVVLYPLNVDGTPIADTDFASITNYVAGIDNDWDRTTDPICLTNTGITLGTEVINTTTYTSITIPVDCYTTKFNATLGTDESVVAGINFALNGLDSSSNLDLIYQFPCKIYNNLLDTSGGTPPSPPESNYYTKAEGDARYQLYLSTKYIDFMAIHVPAAGGWLNTEPNSRYMQINTELPQSWGGEIFNIQITGDKYDGHEYIELNVLGYIYHDDISYIRVYSNGKVMPIVTWEWDGTNKLLLNLDLGLGETWYYSQMTITANVTDEDELTRSHYDGWSYENATTILTNNVDYSNSIKDNADIDSATPNDGDVLVWNDTAQKYEPQVQSGGGGAVDSVFGRTGAVVAQANDYSGSQITNVPAGNISSANTQGAINELDVNKLETSDYTASDVKIKYESNANTNAFTDAEQSKLGALPSDAEANVVDSVHGRTGDIVAVAGDYSASEITNDSDVTGTNVSNALNDLNERSVRASEGSSTLIASDDGCPVVAYYDAGGYDTDTLLLIHADGTDGDIVFTDDSENPVAVTTNGDAEIDTAEKQFGTGSLLCANNGYVNTATTAKLNVYNKDYCLEFWFYIPNENMGTSTQYGLVMLRNSSGDNLKVSVDSERLYIQHQNGYFISLDSGNNGGAWKPAVGWHHFNFTYEHSTTTSYLFLDGILQTSNSSSAQVNNVSYGAYLGYGYEGFYYFHNAVGTGQIDEFRVIEGTKGRTTDFTPPVSAYASYGGSATADYRKSEYKVGDNGITGERPTVTAIGYQYFDVTLGYPIWWNGTNWVNASGTTV